MPFRYWGWALVNMFGRLKETEIRGTPLRGETTRNTHACYPGEKVTKRYKQMLTGGIQGLPSNELYMDNLST